MNYNWYLDKIKNHQIIVKQSFETGMQSMLCGFYIIDDLRIRVNDCEEVIIPGKYKTYELCDLVFKEIVNMDWNMQRVKLPYHWIGKSNIRNLIMFKYKCFE